MEPQDQAIKLYADTKNLNGCNSEVEGPMAEFVVMPQQSGVDV